MVFYDVNDLMLGCQQWIEDITFLFIAKLRNSVKFLGLRRLTWGIAEIQAFFGLKD